VYSFDNTATYRNFMIQGYAEDATSSAFGALTVGTNVETQGFCSQVIIEKLSYIYVSEPAA